MANNTFTSSFGDITLEVSPEQLNSTAENISCYLKRSWKRRSTDHFPYQRIYIRRCIASSIALAAPLPSSHGDVI